MANGVVYYKREAEYDGDRTLDRSLTGNEVDGNFFFLRGYDIERIAVNSETHELTLTRVDGQKLKVNIGQEIGGVQISFNPNTGVLHVITPAGEYDVPGFLSLESGIRIATDDTLDGSGVMTDPLRVSATEKTGTFAAADEFRDLSADNGTLTKDEGEPLGKGYRIVTKENISNFGLLYSYNDVLAIKEDLESASSPWRVPSKADWDKMLNSIEDADECDVNTKMHDVTTSNKWLGAVAGEKLKATSMWAEAVDDAKGKDTYGFAVLPVGYIHPENDGTEVGGKKHAAFWSTTEEDDEHDMFIKRFDDDRKTVYQSTWGPEEKLSIRLVKDYDGSNYDESEYIEGIGMTLTCVLMEDSSTVWTRVNISPRQYTGATRADLWDTEFSDAENVTEIYLINEWDGEKWIKRQMRDGQTIILREYDDPQLGHLKYHEFILVKEDDGTEVLKDTVALLEKEIDDELRELGADIRAVASDVADLSGATDSVIEDLSAETAQRIAKDEELDARITLNNGGIEALTQALLNETTARTQADSVHTEKIGNLENGLTSETATRREEDERLQAQITANKIIQDVDDRTVRVSPSPDGTTLYVPFDFETIGWSDNGKIKTKLRLNPVDTTNPEVATSYQLQYKNSNGNWVNIEDSATIEIMKDRFILNVSIIGVNPSVTGDQEALNRIYDKSLDKFNNYIGPDAIPCLVFAFLVPSKQFPDESISGYVVNVIPIGDFLAENEFGDGLEVDDHLVKVKIYPGSESYLSVIPEGIKLTGIDAAISEAVEGVSSKVSEVSASCLDNEADIATLTTDLDNEVATREAADQALDTKANAVSAAVETVAAGLAEETSNRTAADTTLQSKLNEVSASVDTLSLTYTDDKINLLSNGNVIASIDTTGFTKDRLIKSVGLEYDETGKPYLKIVWKTLTGDEVTKIYLEELLYQAGNGIDMQNNVFSVKIDPASDPYLTVGANGLKLSGVENVAIGNVVTSISPAEAADQSLVRIIDGAHKFYVSNSAADIKHNGTPVASILETLLSKVAALEGNVADLTSQLATANNKIAQLESKLDEVYGDNLKTKVVDTMARTIVGYPQQIGIKLVNSLDQETSDTTQVDKIKIKFAADAEFVADNI